MYCSISQKYLHIQYLVNVERGLQVTLNVDPSGAHAKPVIRQAQRCGGFALLLGSQKKKENQALA